MHQRANNFGIPFLLGPWLFCAFARDHHVRKQRIAPQICKIVHVNVDWGSLPFWTAKSTRMQIFIRRQRQLWWILFFVGFRADVVFDKLHFTHHSIRSLLLKYPAFNFPQQLVLLQIWLRRNQNLDRLVLQVSFPSSFFSRIASFLEHSQRPYVLIVTD